MNVYRGGIQRATIMVREHIRPDGLAGSKRMEWNVTAPPTMTPLDQCTKLPLGDGQNCTGSLRPDIQLRLICEIFRDFMFSAEVS